MDAEPHITIEAIYEHGALQPVGMHELIEGQRYRLLVTAQIPPARSRDLRETRLARELNQRTRVLRDGRRTVDLLGIFADGSEGPTFEELEAVLEDFRQEQASEWDAMDYQENR
jgi:predicted DNA-binding antitoxin AbrB/MazE fold protein